MKKEAYERGFYKRAITLNTAMKAMESRYAKNLLKDPTKKHLKTLKMLGQKHKEKINDLANLVRSETTKLKPNFGNLYTSDMPYDLTSAVSATNRKAMEPRSKFKHLGFLDRKLILEKMKDFNEKFSK